MTNPVSEEQRRARWRLVLGSEAEATCGAPTGPAAVKRELEAVHEHYQKLRADNEARLTSRIPSSGTFLCAATSARSSVPAAGTPGPDSASGTAVSAATEAMRGEAASTARALSAHSFCHSIRLPTCRRHS